MVKFLFSVHTISEAKQSNRQGESQGESQGGGSSNQVISPGVLWVAPPLLNSDILCAVDIRFGRCSSWTYLSSKCLGTRQKKSSTIADMAAQCCTMRLFAVESLACEVPLFNALFLLSPRISSINYNILPNIRFYGVHLRCRPYGSNFNLGDVLAPKLPNLVK